ncbi:histidine phosphatase family protein [Synechococcales cyanobacterium C]|uniref:Histidine phosphatase family protein n=1 Tax=Petrachloros mirabilis ULC683 TaxID=2781853 RepID=A0A8K1ZYS6_9CYAN|nr:histidine phosphatase family protein [Petrachloros mirabilis]NCJ06586.1 histidine phosphatase family protein [Petrachloros mirabilis ULC683]
MHLLLIRHAESIGNCAAQIQAQVDDALTAKGKAQAQQLGRFLSRQSWHPTHLYCSPLVRSHHTAHLLRQALPTPDLQPIVAADLQEIDHGIFQGLTWAEAQIQYPDLCAQLTDSVDWIPIPGGESPQDCRDRAHRFLKTLLATHQNTDRIWVISHGGFLQYLIAELLGCDRTWGLAIAPTARFEFELDLSRWFQASLNLHNPVLWKIHQFNQTLPLD